MVERRIELDRKYRRKAKLRKYKSRLAAAKTDAEKEKILLKIRQAAPAWVPYVPPEE
jgi:hypothetical protein